MKIKKMGKAGILLAVLLIGVGFAAITTTLTINGTAKIGPNQTNFTNNVIFGTATATTGSTATLSTDKRAVTFTTAELTTVGDTATLTYTIKNSSQYGATVGSVTCTSTDSKYSTYVTVTPSRTTNLTVAKGATSEEETVTVKLKKSYPETTTTIAFTCTFTATGVAA